MQGRKDGVMFLDVRFKFNLIFRGTNMVVYTVEQHFVKWACDRRTEDADFGNKNHLFK